jgi:hypothetical protein
MSIRINCISELLPPARSDTIRIQLMHGLGGDHCISIIPSIIKNFTNRFIQRRQNTVVSLMGSIQRCILVKTGRISPVSENTYSDRIINPEKNARNNHHDNLAQVRKSEKPLQYSDWGKMIEASMCYNYNNFNRLLPKIWYKSQETSIHMMCGGEYYFLNHNFRNYSTHDDFFKVICAPISLSFMPIFL